MNAALALSWVATLLGAAALVAVAAREGSAPSARGAPVEAGSSLDLVALRRENEGRRARLAALEARDLVAPAPARAPVDAVTRAELDALREELLARLQEGGA